MLGPYFIEQIKNLQVSVLYEGICVDSDWIFNIAKQNKSAIDDIVIL